MAVVRGSTSNISNFANLEKSCYGSNKLASKWININDWQWRSQRLQNRGHIGIFDPKVTSRKRSSSRTLWSLSRSPRSDTAPTPTQTMPSHRLWTNLTTGPAWIGGVSPVPIVATPMLIVKNLCLTHYLGILIIIIYSWQLLTACNWDTRSVTYCIRWHDHIAACYVT